MKKGYIISLTDPDRGSEKEISVIKPGSVFAYILSDLKPCIEADVLCNGVSIHIPRVLFDTGANITAINPKVIPNGVRGNNEEIEIHGAHSSGVSSVHYCSISLGAGEIVLANVPVNAFDLDVYDVTDTDLIIGMDVITLGTLTVKKAGRLPMFSFEVS